jgi:MFS family permease
VLPYASRPRCSTGDSREERDVSAAAPSRLGRDFQLFFGGQLLSNLGGSVSLLLIPLIVYELTGSALNLGISSAVEFVPYLLFGLVIGAYVDRLRRRRVMIVSDVLRAAALGSVPVLDAAGALHVWWIYVVGFITSVLGIFFSNSESTAIPALVGRKDLVRANGRIMASYSAMGIGGPLIAGAMVSVFNPALALSIDAASFVVSALTLALIRTSFDAPAGGERPRRRVREDVAEGLRYVLGNPVLRSISAMMSLINLFATSIVYSQTVYLAKAHLGADNGQVGLLYAAGGAGVVVTGLLAGRLRRHLSFGQAALGGLMASGAAMIVLAAVGNFWVGMLFWAAVTGCGNMLDINTMSLRQAISPPEMLGRVMSIAQVLAWSAIPLGSLAGGAAISSTHRVAAVYAGCGIWQIAVAALFALGPLGHAQRYTPAALPTKLQAEPVPTPAVDTVELLPAQSGALDAGAGVSPGGGEA